MIEMVKQLKWHHLFVVHGSDDYSTRIARFIMQLAAANNEICILSIQQYTHMDTENHSSVEDTKNLNQNTLQSLLSGNNYGIPILVTMQQSSIQNFMESVKDYINLTNTHSLQMFFSNLLTHDDIILLPKQVATVYSLALQTDQLHSFEEYWQNRIRHIKVNENLLLLVVSAFFFISVPQGTTDPEDLLTSCL
jgi:hypothetical protein